MKTIKFLMICVLLCVLTPLGVSAQIKGNNIVVSVTPDHQDWNYKVGEKANFVVNVRKSGTLLDNVKIDYEAGPEMYANVRKQSTLKDGTMKWTATMDKPGFYRLKVVAHVGGKDYEGLCTAAFSPEKIRPYAQEPKDFDAFWQKTLSDARQTDLNPTKVLLPERCTKDKNVYEISFNNNAWGSKMYGVLSVPVKPGKYPALLRVPGAGVRPYSGDTYTAPDRCIVLEMGVHAISVTMPQSVYTDLGNGALQGYFYNNVDNRDSNPYKRIVTGAVRAVDYIATLPEWDGKTLGVTGSSQGGFLTLAVTALDKRITFLAPVHDAMCDYEAELHGVAGGWPHYFYNNGKVVKPDALTQTRIEGARYYDGVNFAKRITVPGWYSFGYNDEVVPPTSSYGLYNIVKAPKQLSVYPMTGHYWYQEQWDEWQKWIENRLLGGADATACADKEAASPASVLQQRLQTLQKRGIMVGHQDDTMYGTTWKWDEGKSDVLLTVGDYPAVMGFDLGKLELDSKENLDGVPFDRLRREILAHHARGGVVTISWHPWNPVTGENSWDPKGDAVKAVLEGNQKAKFESWLDKVADFINSLQTSSGEKVPVIFRPWHEMNGGWFWWGVNSCTPQQYVALYRKTYESMKAAGCNNIVWAWSPNLSDVRTVDAFLERYPGNDVVDMMGVDIYEFDGNDANYSTNLKETLGVLEAAGNKMGKMVTLSETGCRGISLKKDWFTRTLLPVIKDYPISYVLFWRNDWVKPLEEAYLPGVGDGDIVKDFKAFKNDRKILFAKDIVKVKK